MLRISKDNKKKYQSLGISVNPKYWDFVKNRPKAKCPNREQIQKIILDTQAKLQSAIIEFNAEEKSYTGTTLLNAEKNKFQQKTVKAFYLELLEQYKNEKGISGSEAMALLSEYGVLEYLSEHWEILHTQSRQWIIEDIDEFIRTRKGE